MEARTGRWRHTGPGQAGTRSQQPIKDRSLHAGVQLLLILWTLVCILPLLWAVLTAFKTDAEIFGEPWSLPATPQWGNFVRAWTESEIGRYFFNTLIVVCGGVLLNLLLSSMAAYVLSQFSFRGNRMVYYFFIGGMAFPVFLALVPLFFVVRNLGMLSTYHGLILVYTAYSLPFSIFFLAAFFRTLPSQTLEAALLDGCTHTQAFFRVMLPMARPGVVSVGIFNFMGMWNQYILPLVLSPDEDKYVIAQGLARLTVHQGYEADWSGLFAGLIIAMLPVLIVYTVFQRRVQSGLSTGGFK